MHTTVYKIDKQQHPVVYSTGHFTQYSIVNHDGKESDKVYIYVCVCVCVSVCVCVCVMGSLCSTPEMNTTLQLSCAPIENKTLVVEHSKCL